MTLPQQEVAAGRDAPLAPRTVRAQPSAPSRGNERSRLAEMHESIAAMHAERDEWRLAYQHLRAAVDLRHPELVEPVSVPEQWRTEVSRLRREHAEAREQSRRDSVTASYNRRYLDERLPSLLADRSAWAAGLAVALVDIDWFKHVNDSFGHPFGDRVLRRVAQVLAEGLPEGAFCARYGGEEFVLVLPGLDADAAIAVCEAARARVQRYPWGELAPELRVTVSIGVAHEGGDYESVDPEQHLLRADILLYAAKQSGRNAVAYRHGDRLRLAGAAGKRHGIAQPPAGL